MSPARQARSRPAEHRLSVPGIALAADHYDHTRIPGWMWMPADEVVAGSLRALERGRVVYIPGVRNRLLAVLIHLAPIALQQWVFKQQMSQIARLLP